MPRRSYQFVAFALCVCALSIRAAPVPKQPAPTVELYFFPTKIGTQRVLQFSDHQEIETVTKVERVNSAPWILAVEVTTSTENGSPLRTCTLVVASNGLSMTHIDGVELESPFWYLFLPHRDENFWTAQHGSRLSTFRTVNWEQLDLPYGKVRAIRVDCRSRGNEQDHLISSWYALGLGCVKCERNGPCYELKAFTPGK